MLDRKTNKNLFEGQAHLQFTQANATTKNCKRACPANPGKRNNETVTRAHK